MDYLIDEIIRLDDLINTSWTEYWRLTRLISDEKASHKDSIQRELLARKAKNAEQDYAVAQQLINELLKK